MSILGNAEQELEKQSVRLLKSRNGRNRMSYEILDAIYSDTEERAAAQGRIRMRKARLERWAMDYMPKIQGDTTSDHPDIDPPEASLREGIPEDGGQMLTGYGQEDKDSHSPTTPSVAGEEAKRDNDFATNTAKIPEPDSEAEEITLPLLAEMRAFCRKSDAFGALINGFRGLLLP